MSIPCCISLAGGGPTVDKHRANFPADTKRSANVVSMLGHRLRRWPNIETTLDERHVFAEVGYPAANIVIEQYVFKIIPK